MPRGGKRPGAGRPRKIGTPQNASFEAARPTLDRPQIYLASIESRKEATAYDRISLMKSARWAVNNSGIASRTVRGTARFAVGNGLVPQAQSEDHAFNKAAEQLFEDRYSGTPFAFDRGGQYDFYTCQAPLVESMITDGDVFAQLVKSESGTPMARFFGGEHIGDGNRKPSDEKRLFDGVLVNDENKPTRYRFLPDPHDYSTSTDIPAEDIIHIYRPHRLGALRGMSWLAAAVSRIQDIREAMENELLAAKLNTKIGLTIESNDAQSIGLGSSRANKVLGNGEQYNVDKLFQGVGHIQLKPGEKLNAHTFDRPNRNLPTFVEFLTRDIAYGIGVSPEVIWSMAGLGGTASRAALQDADVFFGGVRLLLEQRFCVRFWRYAIWHFIRSGELPWPGNDWFRVAFVPPQKVSVDFGRDTAAMLKMLEAGYLSPRQYFNSFGQDVDEQTDDIIRGKARRKKRVQEIAQEEGVDLEYLEVFPPSPGSPAPVEAEEPDETPAPPRRQDDE